MGKMGRLLVRSCESLDRKMIVSEVTESSRQLIILLIWLVLKEKGGVQRITGDGGERCCW
mgnify:CR=1 FL=1